MQSLNDKSENDLERFADKDEPVSADNQKTILKILIAGKGGVGKTTLCKTALTNNSKSCDFEEYKLTIGVQFFIFPIQIGTRKVELCIWDLAGQSQFEDVVKIFFRGTKGIILAYDCTAMESYFALHHTWIPIIQKNCPKETPIVLISTKNDLADMTEVNPALVKEFISSMAEKLNILGFIETSSKIGLNIREVFAMLAEGIVENEMASLKNPGRT